MGHRNTPAAPYGQPSFRLSHSNSPWDSPFTQSRAGNNSRLRCLPAKAKVHVRSSVFHCMVGHFRNQMFTWPKGCSGMEVRGSDQYLCTLQVRTFLTNYRMNEPTSDERKGWVGYCFIDKACSEILLCLELTQVSVSLPKATC